MKHVRMFLSNRITLAVLKIALGFVFIAASLGKIMNPADFAKDVYSYVLLPYQIVPLFAATVPWIEFSAGLLLMADIYSRSCALIINGLLVSFIAAIGIDLYRGVEISCGCFDFLFPAETIGWNTINRDIVMFAAGLVIIIFDKDRLSMYGLLKNINIKLTFK